MRDVWGYLRQHWSGDLSLTKAVLINGLCLYLLFVVVLVSLGNYLNVFVGLSIFLIYFVWALVGIFRSGWRVARNESSTVMQRVLGWLAIAGTVIVVATTLLDLRHALLV